MARPESRYVCGNCGDAFLRWEGQCRTCGTGTCMNVTRRPDPPECYGNMTCNPSGKCIAN